jgi:hypothetical protein
MTTTLEVRSRRPEISEDEASLSGTPPPSIKSEKGRGKELVKKETIKKEELEVESEDEQDEEDDDDEPGEDEYALFACTRSHSLTRVIDMQSKPLRTI